MRIVVDVSGTPLNVTSSGAERLTLLDKESKTLRLKLGEASIVKKAQVGTPA